MVWIDEVIAVDTEGGECQVRLKRDALYMSTDGVRQSAMIEWLAQSLGYIRAVQNLCGLIEQGKPPSRTLLVSVRNGIYHTPCDMLGLDKEEVLSLKVQNIKMISPLLFSEGTVSTRAGVLLFSARITGYSV